MLQAGNTFTCRMFVTRYRMCNYCVCPLNSTLYRRWSCGSPSSPLTWDLWSCASFIGRLWRSTLLVLWLNQAPMQCSHCSSTSRRRPRYYPSQNGQGPGNLVDFCGRTDTSSAVDARAGAPGLWRGRHVLHANTARLNRQRRRCDPGRVQWGICTAHHASRHGH